MSTVDRILATALNTFNQRGSHAVTTNDLAYELRISVGNLYYHFRNKEEIVRALFERLNEAWQTRLVVADPARPTWQDVQGLIAEHFQVLWEYRFFYREQSALRQRDPALARRWATVHRRGRADMKLLLHSICASMGGRLPSQADAEHLTDVCWVLADYWLPYMESRGTSLRKSDLQAGVAFFSAAVKPLIDSLVAGEAAMKEPRTCSTQEPPRA